MENWIPAYYCKLHHCYDCQIGVCGKKVTEMEKDKLILTTKKTVEWYLKRIKELERR